MIRTVIEIRLFIAISDCLCPLQGLDRPPCCRVKFFGKHDGNAVGDGVSSFSIRRADQPVAIALQISMVNRAKRRFLKSSRPGRECSEIGGCRA